jgi:hypothetical protein
MDPATDLEKDSGSAMATDSDSLMESAWVSDLAMRSVWE